MLVSCNPAGLFHSFWSITLDGIGDLISVEHTGELNRNRGLAYNILQGARVRISKTEFVACPSCGRTFFDLQSTTQLVKNATGHLKGVTIAVMGCTVNGLGEMMALWICRFWSRKSIFWGKNR